MSAPLTPRTRAGLNIGDTVTLPEGQKAILKFIGKIQGKPGEYAGVELIGEYVSQGRHSGTFNGISYFNTSKPNSGLFITYSKLIGSTLRNTGPVGGSVSRNRLSIGPGGLQGLQGLQGLPQPHLSPSKPSALRRQSLVPTTPVAAGSPRRITNATSGSPKKLHLSTPDSSLKFSSYASNASNESAALLNKQLQEAKLTIAEKDRVLEDQAQLLRDVEESLHEFQMLAKSQSQQDGPYDIDTLLKTIEERDRKLNTLRSEFEQKRQEFRITIDSLQQDMQETSEAYESEIKNLKENIDKAEVIHDRIVELEYMVTSLEKGLEMSQMSEKNARQQLSNLADIENKLLEKEQELKEASDSVEHYRNVLKEYNGQEQEETERRDSSSLVIQQLEKSLEDERILTNELKQEKYELSQQHQHLQTTHDSLQQAHIELTQQHKQLQKSLEECKLENEDYKSSRTASAQQIALLETKIKQLESTPPTFLQDDIEKLESIIESKIFRETELEKEIELLKLHYSPSSRTVSGSLPATPQLISSSSNDRTDDDDEEDEVHHKPHQPDLPIYKSPVKVDPAAGRTLWCGLCEREGHESIQCPYEEEF